MRKDAVVASLNVELAIRQFILTWLRKSTKSLNCKPAVRKSHL